VQLRIDGDSSVEHIRQSDKIVLLPVAIPALPMPRACTKKPNKHRHELAIVRRRARGQAMELSLLNRIAW
jgi:hypothetical protein